MAWTELTDVRCCYEVVGQGDPLLLVPGLGCTSSLWGPAIPELSEHLSLILPDNRGIGESEPHRQPESLRDYAADLIELMDHLQLEKAHVLGVSLGGMIARRLAADHPDRIDRLVLVSCTDRFSPYLRQVMELLVGVLRKLPAEAFARTIETLGSSPEYYDSHSDEIDQRVAEKCSAGIPPRAIGQQLRCLAGECADGEEPDPVHVPTLVIAGQFDALIPSCYSRAMAERIPGSRYELMEGAGHNPLQECPDRVCPLIVDFLSDSKGRISDGCRCQADAGAAAKKGRNREGAAEQSG